MSASYVANLATSIDAATVQLRMAGTLADYTAAQLDAIKMDLGAAAGISPSTITLDLVSAGADVVISATMPAASAVKVVAKYAAKSFTTLGSQQVRTAAARFHGSAVRFGLLAGSTCSCFAQVLAASLAQTTKPRSQGKVWLYLDSDIEELQGSLLAIQVALAGGAGHMATALMLSLKLPLLADILSSHYSGVIRESIEISVSAGSAILEVRPTPARNAARMLRY
jgi:hypothetical protein